MALDFSFLCKDIDDFYGPPVAGCFGYAADGVTTYLQQLISAFGNTAFLAIAALLVAIIAGFIIGTLKTLPNQKVIPFFATCWIEIFRNIPLLVMIFLWYFVIPDMFPLIKEFVKQYPSSSLYLVILALGFFTSARIAEQVRTGIQSTPTGQRYAAQALGFTTLQTYRYVLLPRTLRTIMPPLTSESMGIVKNSAAAIGVSVAELMAFVNQAVEETSKSYEIFLIATVLYVLLALVVFIFMSLLQHMLTIPDNRNREKAA
ncbi:MAG: Glutamate/aspartate ABC transporter permease protein GltJ [Candidatus Tokpelaia hoelldobleri]|uniref:Glutamate/aspartate ABC transporter permease protein GltJ n=1 Tax=Candidatus Tokpelaia hoelldobleri TaxID=1902579 RepID=A0A1U9JTP4_9HYPH|nr:MAG: Glutamate/aspartate ABC transporter permease protein GltJ [Candidatus Tokpelaia hoelldoblerii]